MFISSPTKKTMGDFHFYKQHSMVRYVCKKGDTIAGICRFFDVPRYRITKALNNKKLSPGTPLLFKANVWSHKRGWGTGALLKDSSGKLIKNPITANRNYGSVNYKKLCSAFCIKANSSPQTGRKKNTIKPTKL